MDEAWRHTIVSAIHRPADQLGQGLCFRPSSIVSEEVLLRGQVSVLPAPLIRRCWSAISGSLAIGHDMVLIGHRRLKPWVSLVALSGFDEGTEEFLTLFDSLIGLLVGPLSDAAQLSFLVSLTFSVCRLGPRIVQVETGETPMVYATQHMIGNALVGMTNPCRVAGMDGMQIGTQKPFGGVRFPRPLRRIQGT